ncbi:unnamed protein product [Ectocarpus sp. 6 AP-2014]
MEYTAVGDIPGIVDTLREAYLSGTTRSLEWRRKQLNALRRMCEENEDAMVDALKKDLRRCYNTAVTYELWDIIAQIGYMEDNLENMAKNEKMPAPLALKPLSFEVWKEPFGVVTIIAPWNFPFSLLLNPVAGALAAGNTCVLKPSEVSSASGQLIAELVPKYLEPTVARVVTGGVAQTTELLAQKVDSIMYTGGGKVARIVMAAAAKNLTPVTLELGGKCPTYVDESADLQVAARRIASHKNVNAGQVCIAPDHVLIHHKVRDAFLAHLKVEHARIFPGKEQESETKCRIINTAHFGRLQGLLEGHGGEVVIEGETSEKDLFFGFTVIADPSPDSPLMQEEVFGPVLPVMTVNSAEEAIAFCRSRPTPLAAYVFERNPAVGEKWLKEVASGGACVNDCIVHILSIEGGFGGKGESGMGFSRGKASFDTFTHRKTIAFQSASFDPLAKYPNTDPIPALMKMMITRRFPAWIKPVFRGTLGAAAAVLALLVTKHVSISVSFH